MHLRIFILILLLALIKNTKAQQPDANNLQSQISELQQKLSELQKQLSDLNTQRTFIDSSKKVIIIDGNKIVMSGDDLNNSLKQLTNDSLLLGKGLKIYQNNDSVIINIGGMKVRLQENEDSNDVMSFNDNVVIHEDSDDDNDRTIKTQMFSLRLGMNNFLNDGKVNYVPDNGQLELNNSKSLNIGLGIVNMRVNVIKHYLRFNAGVLYDINNYRFQTDAKLTPRIDSVAFTPKETNQNVSKNKLLATYLMLPVNVQFSSHSKSSKAFTASAGFRIGYMVGAHTKQVVDNKKEKTRDDFNLNPIKYGVTATIGYRWLHLYADYDMSTLFKDNVRPQVTPFQVGIILAGYN